MTGYQWPTVCNHFFPSMYFQLRTRSESNSDIIHTPGHGSKRRSVSPQLLSDHSLSSCQSMVEPELSDLSLMLLYRRPPLFSLFAFRPVPFSFSIHQSLFPFLFINRAKAWLSIVPCDKTCRQILRFLGCDFQFSFKFRIKHTLLKSFRF